LQLAGNLMHSILAATAAVLIALGLALGLFTRVEMGRPADLGEGGNSPALSPRFGPKLLRHLSCPSSFTTPLERGEGGGAQGLDWLHLCPNPTPPTASLCVHHVSWEGHGRQRLLVWVGRLWGLKAQFCQ
jgi:hypothetical protein